jgi:hypothetical protein
MKREMLKELPLGAPLEQCILLWQACRFQVSLIAWGRTQRGGCEEEEACSLRVENYWKDNFADGGATLGRDATHYVGGPKTLRQVIDSLIEQWNNFVRKEKGLPLNPVAFDAGECHCLRCGHAWQTRGGVDRPKRCARCRTPLWDKPRKRRLSEKENPKQLLTAA